MNWSGIVKGLFNIISSLLIPVIITVTGTFLDPNLANAANTWFEFGAIESTEWNTYTSIVLSHWDFFNHLAMNWNVQYFFTALAIASFTFSFMIPPREFSKNTWLNWLVKIPLSKFMSIITRGAVVLITVFGSLFFLLVFFMVFLLSDSSSFTPYVIVLTYAICTLYISFSIILLIEHFASFLWGRISILKSFEEVIDRNKEPTDRVRECMEKLEKTNESSGKTRWKLLETKTSKEGNKGHLLICTLLGYQKILYFVLIALGLVYPFYCLKVASL